MSGLHGKAIKLLISIYHKPKARVKVNRVLYEWIQDLIGMNQGGPNSTNLFRKFLSYMSDYLHTKCGIFISEDTILLHLLWADDLILMSDCPENLQMQLVN